MRSTLPKAELDEVVEVVADNVKELRGAQLLVTGGTGFVGHWLVSSLLHADDRLRLRLRVALLTRRPHQLPPHITSHPAVELVTGDVRALPPTGPVDFVVHGAASSSARFGVGDGEPRAMASTIVHGTEAVLGAATGARVLFLSSGAIYGPCPGPVAEDAVTAPDSMDPASAYAQAKRLAETLCAAATAAGDVDAVVARLFAFVGPGLALDAHFAAGNIIGDVLAGRPVVVRGDGTAVRSYLYTADLVEWLIRLLVRGVPGRAYNVGSAEPVTVARLAEIAASLALPPVPVHVLTRPHPGSLIDFYVPDTERAVRELGLSVRIPLRDALARTLAWHRAAGP